MNNLVAGQIFKNYKEVCEWLGVIPASGNTKISHMKEFDRYCTYHKEGNKFIIDSVNEIPLDKIDGRDGNSEYYEDLETIILSTLNGSEDNHIKCSIGRALTFANLVNKNFQFTKSNIPDSCKILDVDEEYMYTFLNAAQTRFKGIFETALKTMEKKKLIDYMNCIMVCKNIPHIKYNKLGDPIINKDGKVECNIEIIHEIATSEEREIISRAEYIVLERLGYSGSTKERDCYLSGDWNNYRREVNCIIREQLNISYYYKGYSIVLNRYGIEKELKKVASKRNNINSLAYEAIAISNDKRLNNNIEKKELLNNTLIHKRSNIDMRKLVTKLKEEKKKEEKVVQMPI